MPLSNNMYNTIPILSVHFPTNSFLYIRLYQSSSLNIDIETSHLPRDQSVEVVLCDRSQSDFQILAEIPIKLSTRT